MMPWVSGLAAGFPLALVLAAARSLLSGQTIGGRGLGRVCGVPLAQGELSFQVGDLLFLFGDLLFLFRDLLFLLGDLLLGVGLLLLHVGSALAAFLDLLQASLH